MSSKTFLTRRNIYLDTQKKEAAANNTELLPVPPIEEVESDNATAGSEPRDNDPAN